jgi:hypothetical protein
MQPVSFREVQYLPGWALLLLVAIGVLLPAGMIALAWFIAPRAHRKVALGVSAGGAALFFLPCAAIGLLFGKMTTEVGPSEIHVRFGWLTSHAEAIPAAGIQGTEVVRYDPVGEYGGWGIRRRGPKDRALTQRGDRGVRLRLEGDQSLLLGSERPEDLAAAIAQARQESGKNPCTAPIGPWPLRSATPCRTSRVAGRVP